MNYRKITQAFKPSERLDNTSRIFRSSLIASLGCHHTVSDNLLYLKDDRIYLTISLAYLFTLCLSDGWKVHLLACVIFMSQSNYSKHGINYPC